MSKTTSRLPSLDMIYGFVAVGRRMSIKRAAEDLCVTQSAVSRQIGGLEAALGVKLFERGHRSLAFTPEGERLFRIGEGAIQQLHDVIDSLATTRLRRPVTISASIGVTSLWLLPRLSNLLLKNPDLDVRVATANKLLELRQEGVDLAIRYCPEADAPEGAALLFREFVTPVAHPSLNIGDLYSPDTIASHVLIEFDLPGRPWLHWSEHLRAHGLEDVKPKSILRFNHYDQVINAAVAAQGIALGRHALVAPMLEAGRLNALHAPERSIDNTHGYWLLAADQTERDEVRHVLDWIQSEVASTDDGSRP